MYQLHYGATQQICIISDSPIRNMLSLQHNKICVLSKGIYITILPCYVKWNKHFKSANTESRDILKGILQVQDMPSYVTRLDCGTWKQIHINSDKYEHEQKTISIIYEKKSRESLYLGYDDVKVGYI